MESAHHSLPRPDCNSTADVPSFTLRTALSAIPCVSDLCGVDVQWFQDNSSQDFAKFKGIVSVNDFWKSQFPHLLQELLQAPLCFLRSFVVLGYDCIHCVAKSCTTTAYRWLCRDSHPSLRNFVIRCYQITKLFRSEHDCTSAFSARRPVILVLKHMSFEKWVKILCLPDTTFARGSEDSSREELGASRCSGTLPSTRFSVNSSNHSGRSRNGSPVLRCYPFFFSFWWSTRRVSSYSITHTLTSCWCCMTFRGSRSIMRWRWRWRWARRACR